MYDRPRSHSCEILLNGSIKNRIVNVGNRSSITYTNKPIYFTMGFIHSKVGLIK